MKQKKIEAIIASPPNRDELVIQLFVLNGGQWGELFRNKGEWVLEIYGNPDGRPWQLDYEEVNKVLDLSVKELSKRLRKGFL